MAMRGSNPQRPPSNGDGNILEIKNIFPTLQGEGPLAGTPAVFVRLGGCNLACAFCDTDFEDFTPLPLETILEQVEELAKDAQGVRIRRLAVITGGEPLRQPIEKLCKTLMERGFSVQIETNGTLWRDLPEGVQIVCSPKASGGRYHALRPDLLPRINALKFLVSPTHPEYKSVAELGQSDYGIPVYVQPMDDFDAEQNKANLAYATQLAQIHGYRLSLQLHKILGID